MNPPAHLPHRVSGWQWVGSFCQRTLSHTDALVTKHYLCTLWHFFFFFWPDAFTKLDGLSFRHEADLIILMEVKACLKGALVYCLSESEPWLRIKCNKANNCVCWWDWQPPPVPHFFFFLFFSFFFFLESAWPVPSCSFSRSELDRLAFSKGHVKVICFLFLTVWSYSTWDMLGFSMCVSSPLGMSQTVCCGILFSGSEPITVPKTFWCLTFS